MRSSGGVYQPCTNQTGPYPIHHLLKQQALPLITLTLLSPVQRSRCVLRSTHRRWLGAAALRCPYQRTRTSCAPCSRRSLSR